MTELAKMAKNLRAFRIAVNSHDRENPTHDPAYGIGISHFDLERLAFDEGEELWPGVTIHVDGKASGNFRVICGLNHGEQPAREATEEREATHAVGVEA
jgi:hypothetical protein